MVIPFLNSNNKLEALKRLPEKDVIQSARIGYCQQEMMERDGMI
jgi:hypothetical protein